MIYRELFSGLRTAGATDAEIAVAAERFGFSPEMGLEAAVPEEAIAPFMARAEEAPDMRLRSLAPGMPTVAEVRGSRIVPVETIAFSEEEAALEPPAPEESETARFADPYTAPEWVKQAPRMQDPLHLKTKAPMPSVGLGEATTQQIGRMADVSLPEEYGFRGDEERALELARDLEPKGEPDFLSRATGKLLTSGKPITPESITRASVGEAIEAPVEYAADVAGTTAGLAVGAAEPIAAGLLGVGAAIGIESDAYDASVTRMERAMQETAKFYDGKLSNSLTQNIRSNISEMQSGIFQLAEALFSGALTEEELKAANAIDRMVAGFGVGREVGAQVTEGAIAAFALLLSSPGRASLADPVGTFLTIAPMFKALKAGRLKIDMSRLPKPTRALVERTVSLYDQVVDYAANQNRWTAGALAAGKELHAKTTRVLAREGAAIEKAQEALYESAFREAEAQAATVKSAGTELGREVRRATERGEIPIPETVEGAQPLRAQVSPDISPSDIPVRPQELVEGAAQSDVFGVDAPGFTTPGKREFEVFRATADPLTDDISLKPSSKRDRRALERDLRETYISQGMDKKKAAKKAKDVAEEASGRGVRGYRQLDLEKSKKRLFRALGGESRRIVEEMGGTGIVKKKDSGAGLVDLASDEFLEAMGEAVDLQAANMLSSGTLRGKLSRAVANAYSRAAGRRLTVAELEGIDRLVHDAASRMPPERGVLGSTKTYDVLLELPDGTETSLLKVARGIVTDDRKLAGLVFEESIAATAERLSHKVRQRRRQRGWLEALGGRDAVRKGKTPSAHAEAMGIATKWIEDVEAGRSPSLPAALMNNPKRLFGAMEALPPDIQAKLPASFWARLRKGKGFKMMSEDMLEYVGLVDMPAAKQKATRAVRIAAPFKNAADMAPIHIPAHLHAAIDMMMQTEKWRMSGGWLAQLERSFKGNMVARNIGSFMNAAAGNVLFQTVRRGDPFVINKMIHAVGMYRKWRNGKLESPEDVRMLEDIDRTGALGSTYVESELNKAYGAGRGGILDQALSKHAGGRIVNRLIELQESGFSWTDAGAKLEDAIHNYRQMSKYFDMLDVGDWIQARVGPHQSVRLYKSSGGRWRLDSPDGRVLSDAQLGAIKGRAAVRPGLDAFFDYRDVGRAAAKLRGGGAGSVAVATLANPYWTWQNKAMTIPGVQKGLAGQVMSNGPPVITNNKSVRMAQSMDQAAIGLRRAALVQGARNTLGDREYHEALRNAYQYDDSAHKGAVATFNRVANPAYMSGKNWSSSAFLEPFDNLMGVIDALVSAPDTPSSREIMERSRENKNLKSSSNPWAGYDDMTMFFGSLDPNDEFQLNAVFPDIPPNTREGNSSASIGRAIAATDSHSLREVPAEHRQEVKRIRNIIRGVWGGTRSGISAAAELAGMSGGILHRAGQAVLGTATGKLKGAQAYDMMERAILPLLVGGTASRVSLALRGKGTAWRYLPPDADYTDGFDQMWAAITGLGKIHMRAAGTPESTLGERSSLLNRDIGRLKKGMRASISKTLGDDIIDLNREIKTIENTKMDDAVDDSDYVERVKERDNALIHWHKIMGTSAPGERKASKGGLINEMAKKYKNYIEEGWGRAPVDILTPGQRRKGVPPHSAFDLF